MLNHDILQDFFSEQQGQIVCITDDPSLFRSLRYAIGVHTQVPDDLIHCFSEPEAAIQTLEELHKGKTPTIVLVERKIEGEKNTDIILRISRAVSSGVHACCRIGHNQGYGCIFL